MSADNSVVIVGTKRTFILKDSVSFNHQPEHKVWRVAHTQAWHSNFEFYKKESYNLGWYLDSVFNESKVFLSLEDAEDYANKLMNEIGFVEYGIITEELDIFYPGEY